ncbi:MAG: GNAT family N-acetyltransferase [Rhizobiaceae bacterium]
MEYALSEELIIRKANFDDMPAVTKIYAESVLNGISTYELVPPDQTEITQRFEAITSLGYPFIVGESGNELTGYAYASSFRTRPAYRFIVEDSIYVAPAARGKGLGKLLLNELVSQCTQQGFRQMFAVIGGPEPASVFLHRRCGFEDCGTMRGSGYKFGRWLDTKIMQRALGEGDTTLPEEAGSPADAGRD